MQTINWKSLFTNITISLGVGILASLLTRINMNILMDIKKPPLTPPGWLFPIVWTILFVLMGIGAYLVTNTYPAMRFPANDPKAMARSLEQRSALKIYALQLLLNFAWTILFFNFRLYCLCLIVIAALGGAILSMIFAFYPINPLAAKLQIPYLLWVSFAAYLNLGICFLN